MPPHQTTRPADAAPPALAEAETRAATRTVPLTPPSPRRERRSASAPSPAAAPSGSKARPQAKTKAKAKAKVKAKTTPKATPGAAAPPPAPPAPVVGDGPDLSEPWMRPWAAAAAETGDTEAACAAAGVTLGQYASARRRDPAFDALCRLHDQVVDLVITEALRSKAISGDARHQALYFAKVRDRLLADPEADASSGVLTAAMAEAMIRAGLGVAAALPPRPPSRRSSRGKDPARRDASRLPSLDADPDDE